VGNPSEKMAFVSRDGKPARSRASGPAKPSISSAIEVSNNGPLTRSQLFRAYSSSEWRLIFDADQRIEAAEAMFLLAVMVGTVQIAIAVLRLRDLTRSVSPAPCLPTHLLFTFRT
jgi:hypothetical protein